MASKGLAALVPSATTRFYNGKSQANITKEMAAVLDGLSKSLGGETIGIQSGYRSPAYNAAVGGAKKSYHQKGMAVDIDMAGWSTAKRQQAIETLTALGVGGFITYSAHPDMLHVDLRQTPTGVPHFMFDKTAAKMAQAPEWFQDMAAKAKPPSIADRLPEAMQAPLSLAQTQLRDEAIRTAFANPTRALDVPPAPALAFNQPARPQTLNPPARFPGVPAGLVTRAPLEAIPASLTPAPVGRVERAPLPDIGQFTKPAQSLQHPVSAPKPSPLAAAPVSPVTKGPALAPATPNASTLAAQYAQYQPSKAVNMPTIAGMPATPPVTGLPAAKPVAQPLAHPVSVPAIQTPPAAILAPALAPPTEVKDYPVADYQAPPAPPAATAYDVYSGLATQAKDNTGKNTVGMLPDGTTTVTNQWGVTTGMTPYGKQTAVGSLPGISGPLGRTLGKAAIPAVGSMALGPLGGILGALAVYGLSKPGGLLSDTRTVNTIDGPIQAYRVNNSLNQFPSAPSGGIRSPTFSNLSRGEMNSISPKAASDIERGLGGLF